MTLLFTCNCAQVLHLEERAWVYANSTQQALQALTAWRDEAKKAEEATHHALADAASELKRQSSQQAAVEAGE